MVVCVHSIELDMSTVPHTAEGLLVRTNLIAAGIPPASIDGELRAGRWTRLQRGVYLPTGQEVTPQLAAAAVVHTVVRPSVVSHHTAARLHALPLARKPATEHVTVAWAVRRPHRTLLTIHCHDLDPDDVRTVQGIPATSPTRTAFDLLFVADPLTATWTCDQAVRRGLVDMAELRRRVEDARHAPRVRRARRIVDVVDPLSESALETAARMVLLAGKLPPPQLQMPVVDEAGRVVYRLDLAYPEWLVGIELDGRSTHETPDAVLADRHRQNYLVARGWTILRFTWFDVTRRPTYVVSTVRDTLLRLRHAG